MRKFTPVDLHEVPESSILIFGTDLEGTHVGNNAKLAVSRFGAKQGEALGFSGPNAYGIVVIEYRLDRPGITKQHIYNQLLEAFEMASLMRDKTFYLARFDTAPYTYNELASILKILHKYDPIPDNVILPKEYDCRT